MPWDLFCRVVDNFGDIGVCWRLAAQLAESGQPVRLWVDDAAALDWMAPRRHVSHPRVQVLDWQQAAAESSAIEPGEVVIEAFGCDPPPLFVARMAAQKARASRQPVWINLEYLSAEDHVERSHLLPSPQASGPGKGLLKYFFFPGFSPASGGLLREPELLQHQQAFDAPAWLAAQGVRPRPGEQLVSLFCYRNATLAPLVETLAGQQDRATLLLATAGAASAELAALLGPDMRRGTLRATALPWLSQTDYDHLLWSCDLNWVRGEDSAVRAQWAGRPFIWQLYPQADGADAVKATAFLDRFFDPAIGAAQQALAADLCRIWWVCNGWSPPAVGLPAIVGDRGPWAAQCLAWREHLTAQSDLLTRLREFLAEAR